MFQNCDPATLVLGIESILGVKEKSSAQIQIYGETYDLMGLELGSCWR